MLQAHTTLSETSLNGLHGPGPEQAAALLDLGRPADALALCDQALLACHGGGPIRVEALWCMQAARACADMGLLRRADTLSARAEALFLRGGQRQDGQRLDNLCQQLENWLHRLEEPGGSLTAAALQRCLALRSPCTDLVRQAQALRTWPLLVRSCELSARLHLLLGDALAAQAVAGLAGAAVADTPAPADPQSRLLLLQASVALARGEPGAARAWLAAEPQHGSQRQADGLALRRHRLAARAAQAQHDWPAAHAHACAWSRAWARQQRHCAEQQQLVLLRGVETAHAQALQLLAGGLRRPLIDILDIVRMAAAEPGVPCVHRVLDLARNALQASDRALQHARALLEPALAPGTVDLAETADDAVACVGAQAQAAGVDLQPELDPPAWVQAPRALLHDGLVHLLGKALRHSPRGGRVSLRVAADTGCTWHVRLADQGPGFGTRAQGPAGPHPGLVFGDRMARRLSGTVRAGNRPEGGALVELWLPAAAPPAP